MRFGSFDWRWIGLIAVVVVLASSRQLPWPIVALALAASGAYVLFYGWRVWGGAGVRRSRVTYWRGQRIEVTEARRGFAIPPLRAIVPALLYLVVGAVLFLAGISIVVEQLRQ